MGALASRTLVQEFRGYPRRLWWACLAAYATVQAELALWALALPSIRAEFALSTAQLAALTGLTFALGGLLIVCLSTLADRFGRRRLLLLGTLAAAACSGMHVLVTSVIALAVVRTFTIGFSGLVFPATGALVAEEAPARLRGLMVGLLQIAVPLGWLTAALIAAAVLEAWGWRALFATSALGVLAALVVRAVVQEPSPRRRAHVGGGRVAGLFRAGMWRRTVPLFLAQSSFAIAFGGGFVLMPLYLFDARGFNASDSGMLVAIANAMGVLGYVAAAWIGEFHWTRRSTVIVLTLAAGAAFAVFALCARTHAEIMVSFAVLTFFLLGTSAVKFPYIAELYPSELRATGIAFVSSLAIHCGLAFGPLIIGLLVEHVGWTYALVSGGTVPLLIAAGMFLFLPRLPSGLDVGEIESRLRRRA